MSLFATRVGIWPRFAELDGVKVPLADSPLSPKMRRHLLRGGYERAERKVVAELVREGARVIELGSSLGILTSLLAKKVGPAGKVVAVEANRELAPHFSRQLAANGIDVPLVHALGYPLWDAEIPASIRARKFAARQSNLSGRADADDGGGHEVPWRTLKEIAVEAGLEDPNVMVIDVEGGEAAWCDHAPDFPSSVSTVIVEIHPHLIGERRAGDCVQSVVDAGFRVGAVSGTVFGFTRRATT